jgi:hypothetical protein
MPMGVRGEEYLILRSTGHRLTATRRHPLNRSPEYQFLDTSSAVKIYCVPPLGSRTRFATSSSPGVLGSCTSLR